MKTKKKIVRRTPAEVYKLWIKNLRSGKYRQGQGFLREKCQSEYKYCCLGVLCDLAVKDGGAPWESNEGPSQWGAYPPATFSKYLGLNHDDLYSLIDMNDNKKKDFKEIANYIEKIMPTRLKKSVD